MTFRNSWDALGILYVVVLFIVLAWLFWRAW